MAKKCSICNRTYPDNLPACPHCKAAQAKPPTADEAIVDDIEIVGEEAPPPSAKGKKPAPPPLPPADEPIEIVEEVHEPEEVFDADVVEVAEARPTPGRGDSSRVKLDEPVEVVDLPSDMLVAGEATPADSSVRLEQTVDVSGVPEDLVVVDNAEVVEVAGPPSGTDVAEEAPASGVVDVGGAAAEVVEVVEPPQPTSSLDLIEVAEAEAQAAPPEPPPPPGAAKTHLGRVAQPTQIASKAPAPTMLASPEELAAQGGPPGAAAETHGPATPAPGSPAATKLGTGHAAATRIASRAPASTQLADSDVADELPGGELGGPAAPRDLPKEGAGKKGAEEVSDLDVLGDEVLVEGASEVDLGRKPAGKGERPSGVDLIAEALESGVDLAGGGPKSPRGAKGKKKPPSGEGEEVIEDVVEVGPESSAVDLGAPDRAGRKRKLGPGSGSDSDIAADALLDAPSSEFVKKDDVDAVEEVEEVTEAAEEAPAKARGKAGAEADEVADVTEAVEEVGDEDLVVPKSRAAAAALAADEAPAARKKARDEEDEGQPSRRRQRAGGGFLRFVATLLFGILLAGGALAAIWYLKPDLLAQIPESPNQPGHKWQAGIKKGEKVTPAQEAAELLAGGDYDAALAKVQGSSDPRGLPVQGEALWQKYLKEQREKNQPLNAEAPAVKEALKLFQDAGNQDRAKEIQQTIEQDKTLRAQAKSADESGNAVRAALAKINPKLQKANAKEIAKAVTDLTGKLREAEQSVQNINKALADAKLTDGKNLKPAQFKELMDDLAASRLALEAAAKQLKVKADDVPKKVADLDTARKAVSDKLEDVNAKLAAAGIKAEEGKGVQELVTERNAARAQKKELDAAVAKALEEFKLANVLPAGGDAAKQLVAGARKARLKGEAPLAAGLGGMFSSLSGLGGGSGRLLSRLLDSAGDKAQLAAAKLRQALSETPDQRLDTSIALFQGRVRKDPRDVESARRFLDWVTSKGAGAGDETRAKALLALGLAQRNNGLYGEAAKTLKQAADAAAAMKAAPSWAPYAQQTLKELTDPSAFFLPRARELRVEGRLKEALAELDTGLKAIPGDARLHALRALVRLDLAAAGGKLDEAAQEQVRQDADAARKDEKHAAEGYYALGRLEEQLGRLGKAEEDYRSALKAHQGDPEEASVYRSALARLLLRERVPGAEEEEPAPKGKKKAPAAGRLRLPQPRPGEQRVLSEDEQAALLVLMLTAVQAPGDEEDVDPAQAARLKQATELAQELMKSPNPKTQGEGYMILGQVYARQGKRGEGIVLYTEGLKRYYPGKATAELAKMVSEHPAFQQPDSMPRYNPLLAERHFGEGLDLFWARRYRQAEEQFQKAVSYYDQDARYLYYLGMARYQQKTKAKREAARYDFRRAAELEATSRPHSYQVNASLERLQGEMRQVLDRYRRRSGAQ